MRHALLPTTLFLCLAINQCCLAAESTATNPSNRPNIVLMMADDMGMGDTSAYQDLTGNGDDVQLATPQMERLARMGVRMSDAHTPSSRCSPTRYGLMTGRYPWRNRLKHFVLFGVQGDPMIEADRPTIASLLRDNGYSTAMFGKWHVGLRYRQSDGSPAAQWQDADLQQPLFTSPLDHGFDVAKFTSRSHGTSGPNAGKRNKKKPGGPKQSVGPGHVHGRNAVSATGNGKQLVKTGENAYVLNELGGRHSDHAMEFLQQHVAAEATKPKPFFLYYPSNSNHSPYTPDDRIGEAPVAGAARTKSGKPMDARHDFVYENDVALGRILDWLESTDDPRSSGHKLIETTIVIFTSDNGAERNNDVSTGPYRSNKGSVYEGGHRVPFIASWPAGGFGDGNPSTYGLTNDSLIGLQDLFATFAEVIDVELPNLRHGEKGGEDSFSVLAALKGMSLPKRPPLMFHDHKEAKPDPAASAIRIDNPSVQGKTIAGQWKLFFDSQLLRAGVAKPFELYDLATDQWETQNRIGEQELTPLVKFLSEQAVLHRTAGGHRTAQFAPQERVTIDWRSGSELASRLAGKDHAEYKLNRNGSVVTMSVASVSTDNQSSETVMKPTDTGLAIFGGSDRHVDSGEAITIRFDHDVILESAAIVSGENGVCGGFYRVGQNAPLAIYCVDADIDYQDQSGILSDLGVLKAGETLRLDSSPHFGVEAAGSWTLQTLSIRVLE